MKGRTDDTGKASYSWIVSNGDAIGKYKVTTDVSDPSYEKYSTSKTFKVIPIVSTVPDNINSNTDPNSNNHAPSIIPSDPDITNSNNNNLPPPSIIPSDPGNTNSNNHHNHHNHALPIIQSNPDNTNNNLPPPTIIQSNPDNTNNNLPPPTIIQSSPDNTNNNIPSSNYNSVKSR